MSEKKKVLLIGSGAVGSAFAFSLLQQTKNIDELAIIDLEKDIADGNCIDLEDVVPFESEVKIKLGDYSDAKDAKIAVITAGVARKAGQNRLDLTYSNVEIVKTIVKELVDNGFKGIFLLNLLISRNLEILENQGYYQPVAHS